ncbi:MAG: Gfo/Idh/MocA family oxidoreductase [Armatimonadota bacterium]
MSDKIRFGIIGCGGIAGGHLHRLSDNPESEIVALVDTNAASIEKYKERFANLKSARVYSDYKEMLKDGGLDAVQINTPHTLHYDQIMDSLNAGLHVLTEKPLVCNVKHAKEVIAKAEEVGKVVLISYQRHYSPDYVYIKSEIEKGTIGKVTAVAALQGQDWKIGQQGQWRLDPSLSGGGQLNDSGSHLLDILLYTTGLAVESVNSYIDFRGEKVDINSATTLKFTSGAIGTITVIGDQPGWWEDFTVWGTEGAIFARNGKLTFWVRGQEPFEPTDLPAGSDPDQNFIDVIKGRDTNKVPALCGLRGIELCEAAWKSAELGRAVNVSELG